MLLKQVVNMLDHGGIALADRSHRFTKPADGGAQRNAVSIYLALVVKVLQRPPKVVLVDLLHANVMYLKKIDVVGGETFESGFRRGTDGSRAKILRDLTLTASFIPVV